MSGTLWDPWIVTLLTAGGIYLGVIGYIRVAGIRSVSDMEAFDFTTTVAIGTIVGGVAARASSLLQGLLAVGSLLLIQTLIGLARVHFRGTERIVDNRPKIVICDGELMKDALGSLRITENDLRSLLRRRGAWWLGKIRLAVLETGGELTVLTADDEPADGWMVEDLVVPEAAVEHIA